MAKILKSTLIGGFRKKDVIEYLEELNLERQQEQAQHDREHRALSDSNAELHTRLEAMQTELDGVLQEADDLLEELTESRERTAALEQEKQTAADRITDLERQVEELESQAAEAGALRDRVAALEADLAARTEHLQAVTAQLALTDCEKAELQAEIEKLRQPAETAKRVVEAVPELVRTAVDAVPDSVKQNLAETAESAKRKVVAIHRKVAEWSQKEQPEAESESVSEDCLVDSEMAPEQPAPEYKPQPRPMTPEALLETCKTRLGEVAREFNDLYQAVVSLEDKEKQTSAQAKPRAGHLNSIKEILDRVRSLADKK